MVGGGLGGRGHSKTSLQHARGVASFPLFCLHNVGNVVVRHAIGPAQPLHRTSGVVAAAVAGSNGEWECQPPPPTPPPLLLNPCGHVLCPQALIYRLIYLKKVIHDGWGGPLHLQLLGGVSRRNFLAAHRKRRVPVREQAEDPSACSTLFCSWRRRRHPPRQSSWWWLPPSSRAARSGFVTSDRAQPYHLFPQCKEGLHQSAPAASTHRGPRGRLGAGRCGAEPRLRLLPRVAVHVHKRVCVFCTTAHLPILDSSPRTKPRVSS